MPKIAITDHVDGYRAIGKRSPLSLLCLRTLFEEHDAASPSRDVFMTLLSKDFQDFENGNDRTSSRDEAVDKIMASLAKCVKHQIDLKQAIVIERAGNHHTVIFEGVRFMYLQGGSDWTRIPFAGRIEVRIHENRWSTKDAVAEIMSRKMTWDTSRLASSELGRSESSPQLTPLPFRANSSLTHLTQPSTVARPVSAFDPDSVPGPVMRPFGSPEHTNAVPTEQSPPLKVPELPASVSVPNEMGTLPRYRPTESVSDEGLTEISNKAAAAVSSEKIPVS